MQYLQVPTGTGADRPAGDTHFSPIESHHICSFGSGEEWHYCTLTTTYKLDKGAEPYTLTVDRHMGKAKYIGAHPPPETQTHMPTELIIYKRVYQYCMHLGAMAHAAIAPTLMAPHHTENFLQNSRSRIISQSRR